MPYPDNMNWPAFDAAQGRDEADFRGADDALAVNQRACAVCARAAAELSLIVDDETPSLIEGYDWGDVLDVLRMVSKVAAQ